MWPPRTLSRGQQGCESSDLLLHSGVPHLIRRHDQFPSIVDAAFLGVLDHPGLDYHPALVDDADAAAELNPNPIRETCVGLHVRISSLEPGRASVLRCSALVGLLSRADHAPRQRRGRPAQTGHQVARNRGRPSSFPTNEPTRLAFPYSSNERSQDLFGCAAFASSTFDIGASFGINTHPHDG